MEITEVNNIENSKAENIENDSIGDDKNQNCTAVVSFDNKRKNIEKGEEKNKIINENIDIIMINEDSNSNIHSCTPLVSQPSQQTSLNPSCAVVNQSTQSMNYRRFGEDRFGEKGLDGMTWHGSSKVKFYEIFCCVLFCIFVSICFICFYYMLFHFIRAANKFVGLFIYILIFP